MKRKMLALAAVLGITALASFTPPAEAAVPCGFGCAGQPGTTVCYCGQPLVWVNRYPCPAGAVQSA